MSKGGQKAPNLKWKKKVIIVADQTSNPMQKGVCTVYPFFTLE